jgi:hypothetical protein
LPNSKPTGTVVQPASFKNHEVCIVKWDDPSRFAYERFTHEMPSNLILVDGRTDTSPAIFEIGQRVFFVKAIPMQYPLGVVLTINTDTIIVHWDNGVASQHSPLEIGCVQTALESLSLPIP